ncbi:MAG: DUF2156 domain-containing protein [candidate division SR1 bacterium]|nr:DUF2156 domain-containing protein [candidate division SR1 bacterium]
MLSTFVTLQFIQSFGFRLLRSSFDSRFHFLQLITDYLKLLVDPSTLAGLDQVEPKSATAWIFLYLVLFAGALFIILSITLIVIPRISLNNDDLKWNQNPDTRELDIDIDPLAVYKVTQNLDVFYFENITLFYKETATTCFVLGEPIIHDSTDVNLKETITLLKNMMHKKGKSVCFYQLSDKYFTYFKSQNFASINYADEAIIDHSIDLAKPVYKSLRYSHNRLKKENINVIIKCFKDLDKTDFVNFNALKKVWQESNGYQESQFTSGYDLFSKDIDGYLVILSNPNNDILVMYTFLPFGTDQDKSLTLDYILRHPSANSSITEGGLVYSINYFIDKEFTSVSLGLAPNPKIENEYIYKLSKILNIKYNSSGLRNFKQKFLPRWECRYLYLEGFQHISTIYPELQKLMYKEK